MSGQVQNQLQNNATAKQSRVRDAIANFIGRDLISRDMVGNRLPFSARKSRAVSQVLATPEKGAKRLTRFTYRG